MKKVSAQLGIGILAFACLWLAGSLHRPLLDERRTHKWVQAEPLENAPPLVVFSTVALGGFSGFVADLLWVRAAQLQMDGQYMELVQLADWITKLQPRFPEGWIYHAWNLSYNVSVMFHSHEDRWRWVRHGIELLRDGALRYNPSHAGLYRELSWLYQHKIGGTTDQAHLFYKFSWAMEMARLFEGRAPEYEVLAQTPDTRAALLRVPDMPHLLNQLHEAGYDPFTYEWPTGPRANDLLARLQDHPAGDTLLNHVRQRILIDQFNLLPARMQTMETMFGPLDWRMPQAHALYWAWSGRPFATGFDALTIDRMILHNLSDAFRHGRFFHAPDNGLFIPSPNIDLLPYVLDTFDEAIETHGADTMNNAYRHFLHNAVTVLFTHNHIDEAADIFHQLQTRFPDDVAETELNEYVVHQYLEAPPSPEPAQIIDYAEGALYQHYFWQTLGDTDRAAGYERLAEATWSTRHRGDISSAARAAYPAFDELRRSAQQRARETVGAPERRSLLRP